MALNNKHIYTLVFTWYSNIYMIVILPYNTNIHGSTFYILLVKLTKMVSWFFLNKSYYLQMSRATPYVTTVISMILFYKHVSIRIYSVVTKYRNLSDAHFKLFQAIAIARSSKLRITAHSWTLNCLYVHIHTFQFIHIKCELLIHQLKTKGIIKWNWAGFIANIITLIKHVTRLIFAYNSWENIHNYFFIIICRCYA